MAADTPQQGDAGTTLIEILVVVAILGLAATALGADWHGRTAARRLSAERSRLHGLLDAARVEVMRSGRDLVVEIDPQARSLRVPGLGQSVILPGDMTLSARLAETRGTPAIMMLTDGSSTGGTITIGLDHGSSTSLSVSWVSGLVRDE